MLGKFDIASQSMVQSPVPTTLSASATTRFDGALASPLVVGAGVGVATISEDDSRGASGVVEYVSGVGVADGVSVSTSDGVGVMDVVSEGDGLVL